MSEEKLQEGDTVCLVSQDSPIMTIERISDDGKLADVVYSHNNEIRQLQINVAALRRHDSEDSGSYGVNIGYLDPF